MFILLGTITAGPQAVGQDEEPWERRRSRTGVDVMAGRHLIAANAGLFSAVGHLGLTYAYSPIRNLQLELGAGLGFTGLQLSAMPKFVSGGLRHSFVVGAGISVSVARSAFGVSPNGIGTLVWLNADAVGYQFRFHSGLSLLVCGGISVGLGGGTVYVHDLVGAGNQRDVQGRWFPQLRIALGYWVI